MIAAANHQRTANYVVAADVAVAGVAAVGVAVADVVVGVGAAEVAVPQT